MKIPPFRLERYFARHEFTAEHLLCSSDCQSVTVADLFEMEPTASELLGRLWLGYGESLGHPVLREQIASLYERIDPRHVMVHTGAQEAIFSFMNVLLDPGDHIIVHAPGYQSLSEVAQAIGAQVTPWRARPDRGWSLDMDFLVDHLRADTKAVVINCPHNPTGHLMDRRSFEALVALSQERGFLIFSDEVYRGLEHDASERLPALCDVDERGVSLGVMSKSYGLAGLRIGWIATRNADLFGRMAAFKDYTTICNSAPSELLCSVALKHGDALIARNLGLIRDNLDLLDAFFERHPERFGWSRPKAGPIAFPKLLTGDVEAFCEHILATAGVLLLPGTVFGDGGNHFRVGFGRAAMALGLEALQSALDEGA